MNTTVKAIAATEPGTTLTETQIERRALQANDVQMDILYCGICHSDLHQVKNDFGFSRYPMVPGHEIIGRVSAVGDSVTRFEFGDLAGIGCIVDSCGHCPSCEKDLEMFCDNGTTLSFGTEDKIIGGVTQGGFSKTYVCKEDYVLSIPQKTEDLAATAPLLCAGITVYSPLRHWHAGPGKTVGIIGIGGLGHMAIKIARAMGANVVVFTTSQEKTLDAKRLGADDAVLSTDAEQMAQYNHKVDLIIDTVSAYHDINAYIDLLAVDGSLVLVGLPTKPLEVGAFNLVHGRRSFSGSNIGGIAETQEMLEFCFNHNILADIELVSASEVSNAFDRLENGNVKYRFVVDMSTL